MTMFAAHEIGKTYPRYTAIVYDDMQNALGFFC